jgi:two-component system phosphate regulon sensor histidine kinase PhoR
MAKTPDLLRSKLRKLMILIALFAFVPSALLLTVGVLILVLGHATRDFVFGVLTLGLTVTLVVGVVATVLYVRRETSVAQLQTEFVNKVSHDLRTPLTSIRLFVEALQSGRLRDPEKIQQALDTMATETTRLSAMIDRLLGWARMEAGKRSYRMAEESPARIVADALTAFRPQLLIDDVKLTTQVQDDLPNIHVDAAAITEALLNLLQNAYKYTGPQKIITVRCFRRTGYVVFSVSDNGPGIPKTEHRRIFEKFYRMTRPEMPLQPPGAGLGLSMVYHIVAAHDGTTSVESELGQGATFSLHLPIEQPAPPRRGRKDPT